MKKSKILFVFLLLFMMLFTVTSCDIEGLINQYLPGVELPFGDKTKEPTESYGNNGECEYGHDYNYTPIDNIYHKAICNNCDYENFEYHEYDEWKYIVEPTETTDGLKERYCHICSFREEEIERAYGSGYWLEFKGNNFHLEVEIVNDVAYFELELQPGTYFNINCNGDPITWFNTTFEGTVMITSSSMDNDFIYTIDGNEFIYDGPTINIYSLKYDKIGNIMSINLDRRVDDPVTEDNPTIEPDNFNSSFYFLSSSNGYSFTKDSMFSINSETNIAKIEVTIKKGDTFYISSDCKEVLFTYNSSKYDSNFVQGFGVRDDELLCMEDGRYLIEIYNYSHKNSQECHIKKVDEIEEIKLCTVSEALNMPIGSKVKIEGYIAENGKNFNIVDETGSMLLYNVSGHTHKNLYGVVEGVISTYLDQYQVSPCTFTVIDDSQLNSVEFGDIVKSNNELKDGLRIALGSFDKVVACPFNNYYLTSDFNNTVGYHNLCVEMFVLRKYGEYWAFETTNGAYLSCIDKNTLVKNYDLNEQSSWTIEIDSNGEAIITNVSFPKYSISINDKAYPARVTCTLNAYIRPYIYILNEFNTGQVDYNRLYVRGSFNGWDIKGGYELTYDPINYSYFITLSLKAGDQFKIADDIWSIALGVNEFKTNYAVSFDNENNVAPYDGQYEINIYNFGKSDQYCEINFMYQLEDIFLLSNYFNNELTNNTKFNIPSFKNNKIHLIYDININSVTTDQFYIKSLSGYYCKNWGNIDSNVTVYVDFFTIKAPGNYRVIIENYADTENSKVHIYNNDDVKYSIPSANELPDCVIATVEGFLQYDGVNMYVDDAVGRIMIYQYDHAHAGERVRVTGEVSTYLGEKELVNCRIEVLESNYIKNVNVDKLVTSNDEIYDGMKVIITANNYVMGCQAKTYRKSIETNDLYGELNTCVEVITIRKNGSYWTLSDVNGNYLCIDKEEGTLISSNSLSENCYWQIEIIDGKACISNVLFPNSFIQLQDIKFGRFATYSSEQVLVEMYIVK